MSYVLRTVRPDKLLSWIAANAPASVKRTAPESWRAYLVAQGAVGRSISELEFSFLSGQSGRTLQEKWAGYSNATSGNKTREKIRNLYK